MATENIASWAIQLKANTSGLVSGLDMSAAKIRSFTNTATTLTKTMASGLNSGLAQLTGLSLSQQTSQLVNVASAMAGVGAAIATGGTVAVVGAIGAAAATLVAFATASMNAVDLNVRLGRSLGVTAQQAAGLTILADRQGVASEAVSSGVTHWAMQLSRLRREMASANDGPLIQSLRAMGISAQNFASQSLPEQFAQLAEGAQRISDPLQRNSALLGVLGNSSAELLPLFREQADALRNASGVAGEYGYSLQQSEAEGISAAVRGMRELSRYAGSALSMVGQQAALMWAPAAEATTTFFRDVIQRARPFFQAAIGGIVAVTLGGGLAAMVRGIVGVMQAALPVFEALGNGMSRVWDVVASGLAQLRPVIESTFAAFASAMPSMNPFDYIASAITASIPTIVSWTQNIVAGVSMAVEVARTMIPIFMQIGASLTELKPLAVAVFAPISALLASGTGQGSLITGLLSVMMGSIVDFVKGTGIMIAGFVTFVTSNIQALAIAVAAFAALANTVSFGAYGSELEASANRVANSMNAARLASIQAGASIAAFQPPDFTSNALEQTVVRPDPMPAPLTISNVSLTESRRRLEELRAMTTYRDPFTTWADSLRSSVAVLSQMRGVVAGIANPLTIQGLSHIGRNAMTLLDQNAPQLRSPSAVLAGSVAAQTSIAQAQLESRQSSADPITRLVSLQERAEAQRQREIELGEQILQATRDNRLNVLGS